MSIEPIIREYQPDDMETVLDLFRMNVPDYFSPDEENDLMEYLEEEIEHYYVMMLGDQLIGSGGINFSGDPSTGKISWDFFHPEHQGKGYGSRLLKFRIGKLKEYPELKRIIIRTSQLSYEFYEKNGFKVMDIEEDHWAKGYDLYNMEYIQTIS
jgi:[ribosomal protein S18]-alanine N-acetyltransferase